MASIVGDRTAAILQAPLAPCVATLTASVSNFTHSTDLTFAPVDISSMIRFVPIDEVLVADGLSTHVIEVEVSGAAARCSSSFTTSVAVLMIISLRYSLGFRTSARFPRASRSSEAIWSRNRCSQYRYCQLRLQPRATPIRSRKKRAHSSREFSAWRHAYWNESSAQVILQLPIHHGFWWPHAIVDSDGISDHRQWRLVDFR